MSCVFSDVSFNLTMLPGYFKYLSYLPHIEKYRHLDAETKADINADMARFLNVPQIVSDGDKVIKYLRLCLQSEYFRVLFYHRAGHFTGFLTRYKRANASLMLSPNLRIGGGVKFYHPYYTILNARSIGKNFTFRHLTTVGNKFDGRNDLIPVIGDNVTLGANVTILGDICIGNNVIVGAGSVVVKSIPDNCVVAGNPAKIIKELN